MMSRVAESQFPVFASSTLRLVGVALLTTLFFSLPVDHTAAATTFGGLARRAIVGQYFFCFGLDAKQSRITAT